MTIRRHLVIFAKQPRMGRVKTRLAAGIGTVGAWHFYRRAMTDLVRRLQDPRWRLVLAVAPDTSFQSPVWPSHADRMAQGPGDLGRRMQRAFDQLPPGPVVIVGADIPDIGPDDIRAAFQALGRHDAVFGPAEDGGYWLVGAKRTPRIPQMFENVRWSGAHTLADTLNNLQGRRIARLRTLNDIDDAADLARWRKQP